MMCISEVAYIHIRFPLTFMDAFNPLTRPFRASIPCRHADAFLFLQVLERYHSGRRSCELHNDADPLPTFIALPYDNEK